MSENYQNRISVTIITKDEERNIMKCLAAVEWADEVIVLDNGSKDRTLEIAKRFSNVKIHKTDWLGFGKTKQKAVELATNDWILSLDADEVVTASLKDKLFEILKNPLTAGYAIKRKSFYLGKMITHCGWGNDYPIRFFDRKKGRFNDKELHESIVIDGNVTRTEEFLLHYTYPTMESHLNKINSYSKIGAEAEFKKNSSSSIFSALLHGFSKFLKMYLFQLGFLDGKIGLILSINSAYGVSLKYIKLWNLNYQKSKKCMK